MKRIEEAARKFSEGDPQERDLLEIGFRAGARYALDQLTSDSGQRSAIAAYGDFDDGENDHAKWSRVLGAVRKEIEGE